MKVSSFKRIVEMQTFIRQKDTSAWVIQVWAAFLIAISATTLSVLSLPLDRPIDNWMKGQIGVSFLFSLTSSFTLAKTIRDNHEVGRLSARVDEAKVEELLSEHHL